MSWLGDDISEYFAESVQVDPEDDEESGAYLVGLILAAFTGAIFGGLLMFAVLV